MRIHTKPAMMRHRVGIEEHGNGTQVPPMHPWNCGDPYDALPLLSILTYITASLGPKQLHLIVTLVRMTYDIHTGIRRTSYAYMNTAYRGHITHTHKHVAQ
jgi:hypothetical protein